MRTRVIAKKWTVCLGGKKICQYETMMRAHKHATDIGGTVILAEVNPERVFFRRDQPNSGRKAGLPQYK